MAFSPLHRRNLPILLLPLLCGCAQFLSAVMVSAPNRLNLFTTNAKLSPPARQMLGIDQELRVKVGPPEADLSVSIIEPKGDVPPSGTILVLHGIWSSSFWMQGTAHDLADSGFRAVLVDLRGQGRSTGEWLTFGQQESRDLSQVIDELERRRLVAGRLGVYGISYGAATSIQLAGLDPRIAAVVAVAPFSTMRDVVPDYARTVLPGIEQGISDDDLQAAVDEAGLRGAFDPDLSDSIAAIGRTRAQVLVLHGEDDWLVPPYHARRLHEAAPDHSQLVLLPGTGHTTIWFDTTGEVAQRTQRWFEQWLTSADDPVGVARVRHE
jgi:pimeloyl-ACP methyl ester carboxylesterase